MQSRAARGAAQQHFVHSVRNQFENDCKLEKPVHARDWTARRTGARCVSAAGRHTMARARRSVKWRRLAHHDRGSDSSEWGFSRRTINSSGSPPRAGRAHIAKHVHKQNICRSPLSLSLSLSFSPGTFVLFYQTHAHTRAPRTRDADASVRGYREGLAAAGPVSKLAPSCSGYILRPRLRKPILAQSCAQQRSAYIRLESILNCADI